MYIYNVTLSIDKSIHKEWLAWIHNHIPEVLATGKFTSAKLTQVLVEEDMGGSTYSVQYQTDSRKTLNAYYSEDAGNMRSKGNKLFANKFVAFRTELEVISEQ